MGKKIQMQIHVFFGESQFYSTPVPKFEGVTSSVVNSQELLFTKLILDLQESIFYINHQSFLIILNYQKSPDRLDTSEVANNNLLFLLRNLHVICISTINFQLSLAGALQPVNVT